MNRYKMSIAAALLLSTCGYAIDNVKVSGDAKVFYITGDADYVDADGNTHSGLFDQGASAADTALRLGVTGDLLKGVSFGVTGYGVSTLGLENNLVANTWTGAHTAANGSVDDKAWIGELWIAATLGKTTAKLGRMELDTPLAFSEKWSIVPNTFDAAVLINQDIPDTTLIGAWVGKGNGVNVLGANGLGGVADNRQDLDPLTAGTQALGIDGIMATSAAMTTFVNKGAYAAGIVNNTFKPLVAQGWYYNVVNVADAFWLQADWDCQLIKDVKVGVQYANMDPKGVLGIDMKDSSAYAVKVGYVGIENLKVSAAYSDADNDGTLKIANVATNNLGGAQSKLYTEAWWNYGYVGAAGAESVNVTAEYDAGVAKFGAYYTDVNNDIATSTHDVTEVTLTATKSFGPLDATVAYMSIDADDQNSGSQYNMLHAYLALNF